MIARRLGLAVILCLGAIGLAGCTLDNTAARQDEASMLWEELVGGHTFGQTFASGRDGLYRIDLGTATYARANSAPVLFHLRSSPEAGEDLRLVTLAGAAIENERPTSFEFPPLPDSGGKSYYFYLESPEAAPGNAITVYANEQDEYAAGTAYRDGRPAEGDLAFTAYSRETYSLSCVLSGIFSRLTQDLSFCLGWGLALLIVGGALLFALRRRHSADS